MPTFWIKKKNHNSLFFILNSLIKNKKIRTILVYGGKSSSKTISICQLLAKAMFTECANSIAFRKESAIIKTTLKKSFDLAFESMNLTDDIEKLEFSYRGYGQEIVLKGLDKDEKAKGIESYKYVYLDELNHFKFEEYEQIKLSLRGIEGQKIFASWNPVSDTSWVKTKLVDKYEWFDSSYTLPDVDSFVKISHCGTAVLIKTTYLDNYWIVGSPCETYGFKDENLIREYDELKKSDPRSYQVNVLGEWGTVQNDAPFFYSFNETDNYRDTSLEYKSGYLDLSFDFNISPCTLLIGNEYKVIDLILADANTIKGISPLEAVCRLFKKKYIDSGKVIKQRIRITGDASGSAGSADSKQNESFYTSILLYLGLNKTQIFIRKANLSHALSADIINYAFQCKSILIHNLPELKSEILQAYISYKPSGAITLDEAKKEFGLHTLDAFRYIVDLWFSCVPNQGFRKDIKEIKLLIKTKSNVKAN